MIAFAVSLAFIPRLASGVADIHNKDISMHAAKRRHRHDLQSDPSPFIEPQGLQSNVFNLHANSAVSGGGVGIQSDALSATTKHAGIVLWVENSTEFIIGLVLVLISVPGLWFYERQLARHACLVSTARSACHSVSGQKVASGNSGRLVHVTGEQTQPKTRVEDPRFPDAIESASCVRLRTGVQIYQRVAPRWLSKQSPDHKGFDSSQLVPQWSEAELSASRSATPDLRPGTTTTNCARVEYGHDFVVPDGLVDECKAFQSADQLIGSSVMTADGKRTFLRHKDGSFYWRDGNAHWTSDDVAHSPQIGDARVKFEYVPPGPVTILALQIELEDSPKASFLPYRLVSRGLCCRMSDTEECVTLISQAKKTREQLAKEDQCLAGSKLCCGCNLLAGCCTGVLTPEIFRLFEGRKTMEQCFQDATAPNGWGSWTIRTCLWGTCFFGLAFALSQVLLTGYTVPISVVLGEHGRAGICVLLTFAVSFMILFLAYVQYRPIWALFWLAMAISLVVVPNVVAHYMLDSDHQMDALDTITSAEFTPSGR